MTTPLLMAHPIVLGDQVWCSRCGQYRQLVKIAKAVAEVAVNSSRLRESTFTDGKAFGS